MRRILGLAVLVAALLPGAARGAEWVVTKATDLPADRPGSIRHAVARAQPGDVISLRVDGRLELADDLVLDTNHVTLRGVGSIGARGGRAVSIVVTAREGVVLRTLLLQDVGVVVRAPEARVELSSFRGPRARVRVEENACEPGGRGDPLEHVRR